MIDPYGIHLGPLYLRFYGIILVSGAMAAAWLASREAKGRGFDPQQVWDALIWVLILAIVGARLYHVLTPSPSMGITPLWYLQNPIEIFAVWKGGLGIYGGLLGGALGLWLYTRRHQLDFWTWLDIVAPAIPLGQAVGRWGNFVNQELYGAPTNLPWAIYIRPENALKTVSLATSKSRTSIRPFSTSRSGTSVRLYFCSGSPAASPPNSSAAI
jgi:phosphatidylglycerol:prolipoprotein diacylglycerol transferase